jgi:hypothetical protein
VRECLGRSRLAADSKDAGLRIRLRLPPTLANIPWEYLYDGEHGFVSLSADTALVRYVEIPAPVRAFPINPPLRVLAMVSAPSDLPGLSGEEEWSKLSGALSDLVASGMVEVDRLDGGTLAAMQRPLRLRKYHVLHFVGHAYYDEKCSRWRPRNRGSGPENPRTISPRSRPVTSRVFRSGPVALIILGGNPVCEAAPEIFQIA